MSLSAGVGVAGAEHRDRTRYVWLVLVLSTLAFFGLCALLASAVFGFLSSVTEPQTARLELRKGTQLTVQRLGGNEASLITSSTVLNEGDRTTTGADSEGFIELFGTDITLRTYFSTTVTLDTLRTSRFFQNLREMRVTLHGGTLVVATGAPSAFTAENYVVATDDGDVLIPNESRVRIYKDSRGSGTTVVVETGTVTVFSQGNRVDLGADRMVTADGEGSFSAVTSAVEELISNGNFIDPWTRLADTVENGGLGIAAWSPFREPPGTDARLNPIQVITETVGSSLTYLVDLRRDGPTDQYGRIGIRQEINRPVDYLQRIELRAAIRVVQQPDVIGGPSGNIYPLTIRVNFTDAQGEPGEWVRSFYYWQESHLTSADTRAIRVEQNRWTTVENIKDDPDRSDSYTLKPNIDQPGKDPDIINSIEIYGYGPQFNSSINSISLFGN